MRRTILSSKIHRATVTGGNIDYVGSIYIDRELMDAAGILPNEKVQVVNVTNAQRSETYALPAETGSGEICPCGGSAKIAKPGDLLIIMAYKQMSDEEAATHEAKVIFVDKKNQIISKEEAEEQVKG